jgi:hypothetical protein
MRSSPTWGQDAVDATASDASGDRRAACPVSDRTRRKTNGADAYGKTVWSGTPLLVSSWRRLFEPYRVFDQPLIRQRR